MKKIIIPIVIVLLFTSCQNKYVNEVVSQKFYRFLLLPTTEPLSSIYFEPNRLNKSKGVMIFEEYINNGQYVIKKAYYNYKIKNDIIDISFISKSNVLEVPKFKQLTININDKGEIGNLGTDLNGEDFIFVSVSKLAPLLN